MAKTAATFSGDFTRAELSNADGATKEITIFTGERANVRERSYDLIADNTKDSNRIEVKSETDYVKAMAVKDGVTVLGGGRHVIAEANRNSATGSAYGDNAKMAIQTDNAMASFISNCPNASCSVTVTETKSRTLKDCLWEKLPNFPKFWRSDDQKALPNCEQPALQPQPEIEGNTSSSKGEKRKQKPSKEHDKSHN